MKRVVYLIRHSQKIKKTNYIVTSLGLHERNVNNVLSVEGEKKAEKLSEHSELQNIDLLFSSAFPRAISTAKYIAEKNSIDINIIDTFGERRVGARVKKDIPNDYEVKQVSDENYKIYEGESRNETTKRMYESLEYIFDNYNEKRLAIVSHETSMIFLLFAWCDITLKNNNYEIKFKDKLVFKGRFKMPHVFKLTFDGKDLINIESIEVDL